MTLDTFMNHCTACGGNWTAMIMTGIKEVAPEVYDQMPDRTYEFDEVCFIANHLCSDRPHFRYNISMNGYVLEWTPEGKLTDRKATEEEMQMSIREFYRVYNGYEE